MVWSIWKERNSWIFEGRAHPSKEIWKQTRLQITESLGLHLWEPSDLKASPAETRILERWGINSILAYIGPSRIIVASINSPEKWEPPPQAIFKLNFDGEAKGNPSLAGVGGAIRDSGGEILWIY